MLSSICLIISYIIVLFFTLIGVETVFDLKTTYGFIFFIFCPLVLTLFAASFATTITKFKKSKPNHNPYSDKKEKN